MGFAVILFVLGAALGAGATFVWCHLNIEGEFSHLHHDYQQQITDLLKRIRKLENQ